MLARFKEYWRTHRTMLITLSPTQILHFVAIFFSLFALALVYNKTRLNSAAPLLLLLFLGGLFNLLEELDITRDIHLITPVFLLAKGPAFYIFTRNLLLNQGLEQRQLMHFLPSLVALPFTGWPQIIIAIATVSQAGYTLALFKVAARYHSAGAASQSDSNLFNISWINFAFASILLIGVFDIVRLNLQPYIPVQANLTGQFITTFLGLFIYSYLIVKLIKQQTWLADVTNIEQQLAGGSSDIQLETALFQQIHAQILSKQLYKIPRLSLRQVAEALQLVERDVSRAINLGSGNNFNDYINQLRIEAIKPELLQAQNRSILDIAMDNGFNSKSSFNQVFKQQMQMTPGQYIRRQQPKP